MKKAKGPVSKGAGFADAMFAIKDMQMDYASFSDPTADINPPIVTKPPPQKNPLVAKPKPKPEISKPVVPTKPKTLQQQQSSTILKQQFKIAPGKQFQNHVNLVPLNVLPCTKAVYQLTTSTKKSNWEYNVFGSGTPADTFVQKPQISFSFNAEDIRQGSLGNCYFVSALAAVAHQVQVLRSRIPQFKEYDGKTKSFRVNMFQSGKCIEIVVDNLFQKVFCKPVGNDITPIILQKAYAQSYGNYQILKIGHANDALRDLTGAPSVYLDIGDPQELRNGIKSAFLNKYGLVVASKPQTPEHSISSMHSYNILNYDIIDNKLFLNLRDPRGSTNAYFQVPQKLVNQPQMGCFWIDQKRFQQNFEVISVSKIRRNYSYFYKTFDRKELTNNRGGLLLSLSKPGKVYATIHQKHKKLFDDKFTYDIIRILIAQVSTSKNSFKVVKSIQSDFNSKPACCIEADLGAKQYMILGEIGKKKGKELYPNEYFTLSVYSQTEDINFEQVTGNIDPKPFLTSLIKEKQDQYLQSSTPQGLFRYQVALFGYICMYYQNRGVKKVLEELQYTSKNVEVGQKKVQLGPHSTKLIIHPIGAENNCSYKWSMKSKTVFSS